MEGFFDKADFMAEVMASSSATTAQRAPTRALVLPSKLVPVEESTHARRVFNGESAPILAEILTPQKEITSIGAS